MTPDFIYWLPWLTGRHTSHTIPALFTFCLPAGFSVFWLYHLLIKAPLLALLPGGIFVRLPPLQRPNWHLHNIAFVLLAVLLGATTHLVWDAFTHADTLATQLWPFLDAPLLTRGRHVLRVYEVLQHGSTLVGLGALTFFSWRWHQRTPPRQNVEGKKGLMTWEKVALASCLVVPSAVGAIHTGLSEVHWDISLLTLQTFLSYGAVAGIGIFSTALLILGLLWPWVERQVE
jgi:hypothetical protein